MSKKMQVFIVDDDHSFGRSLKRMLDSRGYSAHYFESASSFLDTVPSGQKGIAILDIHMPQDNGFSLLNMMRGMHYIMPVILVTGQTNGDTRDMALQKGATGFLQKPFNEQSLLDLVELTQMEMGKE